MGFKSGIKRFYFPEIEPRDFGESKKDSSSAPVKRSLLCVFSFLDWYNYVFLDIGTSSNIDYLFFESFFTILILVDVFILLVSFQYTERYSQLIRNTGFIISTILLRLSFSAVGLTSLLLLVSGIVFGLIILLIYNNMERQKK